MAEKMIEIEGVVSAINPTQVALKCKATTIEIPIQKLDIYLCLLKLREAANLNLRVKIVVEPQGGYAVDVKTFDINEWKSALQEKSAKKENRQPDRIFK